MPYYQEDYKVVFCPLVKNNYEWLNPINKEDYATLRSLDGTPRLKTWTPLVVRSVRMDNRHKQLVSDFPWIGSVLVFRQKAVDMLKDILDKHGELLPLITEDGTTLFLHNTRIIQNAMDVEKSELVYFTSSDRIKRIKKLVFNGDAIQGIDMFRLPAGTSRTFVSEKFAERVTEHKLVGLVFDKVPEFNW